MSSAPHESHSLSDNYPVKIFTTQPHSAPIPFPAIEVRCALRAIPGGGREASGLYLHNPGLMTLLLSATAELRGRHLPLALYPHCLPLHSPPDFGRQI